MVSPKTYTGFDASGNAIAHKTGYDALQQLNPTEVTQAVEDFNKTVKLQILYIKKALLEVCADANTAMVVQDVKVSDMIDKVIEAIDQFPEVAANTFAELPNEAMKAHDLLQENNNNDAIYALKNTANVVSVKQGYATTPKPTA